MQTQHSDLDHPKSSAQELTKFQDAILFFLMVAVVGLLVWLFIPKVEHFHADPASQTIYRQWTYGTVEIVTPDKTDTMGN
jgi:hypothetical protein